MENSIGFTAYPTIYDHIFILIRKEEVKQWMKWGYYRNIKGHYAMTIGSLTINMDARIRYVMLITCGNWKGRGSRIGNRGQNE